MQMAFAWIGALLFVGSLVSFVVVYFLVLGRPAPASAPVWPSALLDIALFTAFAVHHSVMARTGAKAWINRLVAPDLERSVYVWIASLLFLAVCWLWQPLPGVAWTINGPWRWAMSLMVLAGFSLTARASGAIGVLELAGVRPVARDKKVEFKAAGPFALVRHPIYLGWILIVFGMRDMTYSRLLFAVVSTVYLVAAIPWEEASLVEAFGDKYRHYQRQVRSRLLPGIW